MTHSICAGDPVPEFILKREGIALFGSPGAHLTEALLFLAEKLHPTIEAHTGCEPGFSQQSGVLPSLVARDVLHKLGFEAEVAPAILRIQKGQNGRLVREHFIGQPGIPDAPGMWNAHMVVLVQGFLVDFALGLAWQSDWPELPTMLAGRLSQDGSSLDGRFPRLFGLMSRTGDVAVSWFDNPEKVDWRKRAVARPKFREAAVRELIAKATRGRCRVW